MQAPSRISWGTPDLVRTVGIVGTVGLGGYYLWNRLPERSDASTAPDRVPPPSPPTQSPHSHSPYCSHFKYFYAPPPPTRPQTVTLQSPPSSPHPSSSEPPPPPPPRPILKKGRRKKQGARPRKRVTIVLPPPSTADRARQTPPLQRTDKRPPWSSRQRQQEARRSSAPQPAGPSSTDTVDSQQTPGGSPSQPDDAPSTGRRDFDLGVTAEEHEALYRRYLASNPTKEQLEFYERAFRKQGTARGHRDGGD